VVEQSFLDTDDPETPLMRDASDCPMTGEANDSYFETLRGLLVNAAMAFAATNSPFCATG
jgi:hypothetical protein